MPLMLVSPKIKASGSDESCCSSKTVSQTEDRTITHNKTVMGGVFVKVTLLSNVLE